MLSGYSDIPDDKIVTINSPGASRGTNFTDAKDWLTKLDSKKDVEHSEYTDEGHSHNVAPADILAKTGKGSSRYQYEDEMQADKRKFEIAKHKGSKYQIFVDDRRFDTWEDYRNYIYWKKFKEKNKLDEQIR